jgi:pantoate kinase
MTPEVHEVTRLCDTAGVPSGMTMLGNGVFAYGRKARDLLLPFGPVYEFCVADAGARIIEEPI